MMSNAIATQTARMGEYRGPSSGGPVISARTFPNQQRARIYSSFTVRHITLKKG